MSKVKILNNVTACGDNSKKDPVPILELYVKECSSWFESLLNVAYIDHILFSEIS